MLSLSPSISFPISNFIFIWVNFFAPMSSLSLYYIGFFMNGFLHWSKINNHILQTKNPPYIMKMLYKAFFFYSLVLKDVWSVMLSVAGIHSGKLYRIQTKIHHTSSTKENIEAWRGKLRDLEARSFSAWSQGLQRFYMLLSWTWIVEEIWTYVFWNYLHLLTVCPWSSDPAEKIF